MKRLSKLYANLSSNTSGVQENPTEAKTTSIKEEIDRQKIIRKKYQSLEDTERLMSEWKGKGSLDLLQLESYVLGEVAQYGHKYLDFMKNDPDYSLTEITENPKDDQRRVTNLLLIKLVQKFPISLKDYQTRPWDLTALFLLTALTQRSVSTKIAVHFFLYGKSILTLGTEKHLKYVENALTLRDFGCFGLTELTHGSNVQGCITNAVFDERRKNFVLYTPHERGIKFWIGNAAHTANMAVIGANLIVKGKDYGIHLFLVEIRDRVTHNLIPGVTLGDCGEKMGLNGVDNGFIAFRGLRVARDALLNRITDVDENGNVTSKFDSKSKRFAVQLSALSDGRSKVGTASCMLGIKTTCIALRFASIRRQFGKEKYKEIAILEYPSMQNRLLPLLANSIIPIFAARKINNLWFQNSEQVLDPKNKQVKEMHALISVIKPLTSEWMLKSFEECRKAMGGLGYSSYAEIPIMLNDLHIQVTWEGDNNVLLQQVGKFIFDQMQKSLQSGEPIRYASLCYLGDESLENVKIDFEESKAFRDLLTLQKLMRLRAKRAAQLGLETLGEKMGSKDPFDAWNDCIPFGLEPAAKFYGELFIFEKALQAVDQCPEPRNKEFIQRLLIVFALTKFRESFAFLTEALSAHQLKLINQCLIELYEELKYDAVLCFDGLLMEDELVRSPFGSKSGNMYEQFLSKLLTKRDNFGKPPYWKEIVKARGGSKFDLA